MSAATGRSDLLYAVRRPQQTRTIRCPLDEQDRPAKGYGAVERRANIEDCLCQKHLVQAAATPIAR